MSRYFDETASEYLENDTGLVSGVPLSISVWMYSDDFGTADDQTLVFIGDKDVSNEHFLLRFGSTDPGDILEARHRVASSTQTAEVGPASVNTWHHCAGVFAATNDRIAYLDGASGSNTNSMGDMTVADRISIGRAGDSSPGDHFSGRLAEVGVWNVALTQAEIDALAAGYSPLFVRPQSLVFYAPLIRDEDFDKVGGLSLTAFNTPTIAEHPPVIYPAQVYQGFAAAAAPPAGLSIPVAMHHYRQQGMSY
jgi:hypothetical protein